MAAHTSTTVYAFTLGGSDIVFDQQRERGLVWRAVWDSLAPGRTCTVRIGSPIAPGVWPGITSDLKENDIHGVVRQCDTDGRLHFYANEPREIQDCGLCGTEASAFSYITEKSEPYYSGREINSVKFNVKAWTCCACGLGWLEGVDEEDRQNAMEFACRRLDGFKDDNDDITLEGV